MSKKSVGIAMMAAGVLLMIAGVALAVGGGGDETSAAAATTTPTSSAVPSSTSSTTTTTQAIRTTTSRPPESTTTTTASETVESFVETFSAALETGDADFLYTRLHPAVVDGYGEDLCRAWIDREVMGLSQYQLVGEVSDPVTHIVSTPKGAAQIDDFYTATVSFVFQGTGFQDTAQFAALDGHIYWIGTCR